jgi:plasmid stabilization system protein ParE
MGYNVIFSPQVITKFKTIYKSLKNFNFDYANSIREEIIGLTEKLSYMPYRFPMCHNKSTDRKVIIRDRYIIIIQIDNDDVYIAKLIDSKTEDL